MIRFIVIVLLLVSVDLSLSLNYDDIFKMIDANNDGKVSSEELAAVKNKITENVGADEQDFMKFIIEIFEAEAKVDGGIDKESFIALSNEIEKELEEQQSS